MRTLSKIIANAVWDIMHNESLDGDIDEAEYYDPGNDTLETESRDNYGEPRIKINKPDGSRVDMTDKRVKKWEPEPRIQKREKKGLDLKSLRSMTLTKEIQHLKKKSLFESTTMILISRSNNET